MKMWSKWYNWAAIGVLPVAFPLDCSYCRLMYAPAVAGIAGVVTALQMKDNVLSGLLSAAALAAVSTVVWNSVQGAEAFSGLRNTPALPQPSGQQGYGEYII